VSSGRQYKDISRTWPQHTWNSLDHLIQVLLYLPLPVESCDRDVS
jgi:hypothetical protein